MLHITSLSEGLDIFKALGSDVRIEILNILLENNNMSMNELASNLNITNGALTSHIKKLESCGLITISSESAGHGNQKLCSVHLDKILIDLEKQEDFQNIYSTDLKVGHYSNYRVCPTCGLASDKALIGEVDDARYFDHPERYTADILWFTKGFVEYNIPNFIPSYQKITQLTLSAELCSERPVSIMYGPPTFPSILMMYAWAAGSLPAISEIQGDCLPLTGGFPTGTSTAC